MDSMMAERLSVLREQRVDEVSPRSSGSSQPPDGRTLWWTNRGMDRIGGRGASVGVTLSRANIGRLPGGQGLSRLLQEMKERELGRGVACNLSPRLWDISGKWQGPES